MRRSLRRSTSCCQGPLRRRFGTKRSLKDDMSRNVESSSYSFSDLMGAVGGYLGLFIGWSIYGMMEDTASFGARVTEVVKLKLK